MTRMITFPEVLDSSGNWLFQMDGYTAEKNSSGGTGSGAPSGNAFQVEKGSSYITTSGRPVSKSESSALQMRYAQSISNHYYMTAYCGWPELCRYRVVTVETCLVLILMAHHQELVK